MSNRRIFLKNLSHLAVASAVGATMTARADVPIVDEKDPQAIALGYKNDSSKVDKVKYPNHVPTQLCNNCQLFQGKASDATGPCVLFPGKVVSGRAWCSAYAKKA